MLEGMIMKTEGPLYRPQRGFSLVELMIAVLLSGVLASAVISVYVSVIAQADNNNQQAQLNHNLRASLDLIVSELRRAGGYDAGAIFDVNAFTAAYTNNPFTIAAHNLALGSCSVNVCDCVIYSYDLNRDGLVGVSTNPAATLADATIENTANVEQFGFRLNGGMLEMRRSRSTIANTGFDCTSSTGMWQDLTDPEITIDDFNIRYIDESGSTLAAPVQIDIGNGDGVCSVGETCFEVRNLDVEISGSLGEFSLTVSSRVRVRNDRLRGL